MDIVIHPQATERQLQANTLIMARQQITATNINPSILMGHCDIDKSVAGNKFRSSSLPVYRIPAFPALVAMI